MDLILTTVTGTEDIPNTLLLSKLAFNLSNGKERKKRATILIDYLQVVQTETAAS